MRRSIRGRGRDSDDQEEAEGDKGDDDGNEEEEEDTVVSRRDRRGTCWCRCSVGERRSSGESRVIEAVCDVENKEGGGKVTQKEVATNTLKTNMNSATKR